MKNEIIAVDMAGLAYPFIAARIFNEPLMIEAGKLDVILSVVGPRIGVMAASGDVKAVSPFVDTNNLDRTQRKPLAIHNGVAVIDIVGTLVNETNGLQPFSGMTPYQGIAHDFESAISNPNVKAIMLRMDSPGGEAAGVWDLADAIANSTKPTAAVVNNMAASSAYLLAASAQKIFVSQGAVVGSIGVIAKHIDRSGANAQAGIKITHIYRGERKADFVNPLNEQSTAALTSLVDATYTLFADKVAALRGMTRAAIDAQQSGIFHGAAAIEAGMADAVNNESDALAWLSQNADALAAAMRSNSNNGGKPMNTRMRLLSSSALISAAAFAPEGGAGAAPAAPAAPVTEAPKPAPAAPVTEAPADPAATSAAAFASASPDSAALLRAEGASLERKRIVGLEQLAVAGEDALLAKFKADGTSVADAALGFATTRREAKDKQRTHRSAELPKPAAAAASASGVGDHPAGEGGTTITANAEEVTLRAQWNADADLRATYGDHEDGFNRFAAYTRHVTNRPGRRAKK